jgi:hypothetical protein
MTDRLDEIEARLAAATPGPWYHDPKTTDVTAPEAIVSSRHITYIHSHTVVDHANADLIANAPVDLAALVAVARAARRLVTGRFFPGMGVLVEQDAENVRAALRALDD